MSTVALRFGATDDGLSAQFRKVSTQLSSFERESARVGNAVASSFSRVGAAIGGITVAVALREVVQFADGIDKAARQTGIAVESLQKLQFIAGQVGTSTDSITRSINRLQVTLVSAGDGSKEAAAALGQLGVPVEQFIALAPDEQFERVAKQIAAIENPTQRAAAAIGLFGRGGAELLPILTQTADQLGEIETKFSNMGGAVSAEAIEAVDGLGDAFDSLKGNTINLGTELVSLVSGPITKTLDGINSLIGSARFLAGGGGELERLQNKLRLLQDERDTIPLYFNLFGYVDGAPVVMQAADLDRAIGDLRAKIEASQLAAVEAEAGGRGGGPSTRRRALRDLGDLSTAPSTSGSAARALPATTAALTPEERRINAQNASAGSLNLLNENFELEQVATQAHLDKLLEQYGTFGDFRVQQESAIGGALVALRQEFGIQEIDFEALKSATLQDIQQSLVTSGLQIATAAFGANKKVALGIAAINVGVAATEALASKIPFPGNLAAVAKVLAMGAQLTARIRSASIGGGGTGGGGVGGSGGGVSQTAGVENRPEAAGVAERSATNIYINGVVDRRVIDQLVGALRGEMDRDVVIIPGNSRQAIELRGE